MRLFLRERRRRRGAIVVQWLAWGLAALAIPVWAQTAVPLPLEEAVRRAGTQSGLAAAAVYQARSAREMAAAAAERPDPELKAELTNVPVSGPDRFSLGRDSMTMRSIGLSQQLTRSDKRQARSAGYEREAEVADAARLVAMADAQREAAIAWLDLHYQQRLLALLESERAEAVLQVQAADLAYRQARGSQADALGARAAVARLDDRLAQARREAGVAHTMLERWIGVAATRPLAEAPAMNELRLKPADLEARLEHHPQIAVLTRQQEVAEAQAELARLGKRADWTVGLSFGQRGAAYPNMVSLSLAIPLQWNQQNLQDREVSARLATAEQMRSQRDEAVRAHLAEAQAMLQEWQGNRERLDRYDTALSPLAAERSRAVLTAYRAGTGNLAGVLDARQAEIETRIDRLRLEMETARLWARLNFFYPLDHSADEAAR